MKRLLVALLLFATPASAKTLIVANTADGNDANYGVGERLAAQDRIQMLTAILDAIGTSYVVIAPAAMRTEWARTGVVTHDFGTSSARTETFDAVIHAMWTRKHTGSPQFASYRPDSLGLAGTSAATNRIPLVPQLFLGNPDGAQGLAVAENLYATTTTCSLGGVAAAQVSWENGGAGSGSHDEEGVYYQPTTHGDRFTGTQVIGRARLSIASAAAKGISVLLAHGTGPIGSYPWDVALSFSTNQDSTGMQSSPDTAQVWMVRNIHYSGGKPIIVAHFSEGVSDGGGGVNDIHEPLDIPVLLAALAALDSASGGLVFDKTKLPLRTAITIDGLCSRSAATNSGGIVPTDTANFYATIDSLDAYDIPVTFGVNLDSVATYPRDLQYVKDNYAKARFSPQSRAGLDTAVAFAPTGGITHRYRAVDTFGRYRNQARAYGPAGGATADTSLYAKLLYAKAIGDSMWGSTRTSKFALPPDDDWSPYNWRADQADYSRGVTSDSILYAYAKAGFRGIRINGAWDSGRPNITRANPRGYIPEQGRYATADRGLSINLVAHNASSTYGNLFVDATPDSAGGTPGSGSTSLGWYATLRYWHGLFAGTNDGMTSGLSIATEPNLTGEVRKGRIFNLSCQELAGASLNGGYKRTLRPSWWAIRRVVMPARIINRLAGRTIISIGYPEDITL